MVAACPSSSPRRCRKHHPVPRFRPHKALRARQSSHCFPLVTSVAPTVSEFQEGMCQLLRPANSKVSAALKYWLRKLRQASELLISCRPHLYVGLLTAFSGIAGFLFGYDTGNISGALPFIQNEVLATYKGSTGRCGLEKCPVSGMSPCTACKIKHVCRSKPARTGCTSSRA